MFIFCGEPAGLAGFAAVGGDFISCQCSHRCRDEDVELQWIGVALLHEFLREIDAREACERLIN